jgi:hypothetical protein
MAGAAGYVQLLKSVAFIGGAVLLARLIHAPDLAAMIDACLTHLQIDPQGEHMQQAITCRVAHPSAPTPAAQILREQPHVVHPFGRSPCGSAALCAQPYLDGDL